MKTVAVYDETEGEGERECLEQDDSEQDVIRATGSANDSASSRAVDESSPSMSVCQECSRNVSGDKRIKGT